MKQRYFYPQPVERPNSKGGLYAPVDVDGHESGDTPSHDFAAVMRRCAQLNAAESRKAMNTLINEPPAGSA